MKLFLKAFFLLWLGIVGHVYAEDFSLTGRISVRHADTAYHGNLSWQHSRERDQIVMTTPLGQGIAELRRDAGGAVLRLPDGREDRDDTLEVLATRLFGAPLPVSILPDWICGIAPQAELDAAGRPQRLTHEGWRVEWLRYDDAGKPQLLTIEGETLAVRLRIDEREALAPEARP